MSTINWSVICDSNEDAVVDFAEGTLSLRNFKNRVNSKARTEVSRLEKLHGTNNGRVLARKALRRRHIKYTLSA